MPVRYPLPPAVRRVCVCVCVCVCVSAEEAQTAAAEKLSGAAKSLCVPLRQPALPEGTKCVNCGLNAINWCMFGRSY